MVNPKILVDLRYATTNNFTGKKVYDFEQCFLLKQVAANLNEVQKELELVGLGIKIWDGYRPLSAQWKFWEIMPDERYVSDPRKGGRHTRGTAVDLTLVDSRGLELLMPTLFDDFSEKAHRDHEDLPPEAMDHRDFLREVMEAHGFSGIETEWWHYDLVGWEQFPLIEQSF
ncbi:MAG TPA: D-alanyl-D-alanine dipeptidase [Chlamydiales bacterium]